MASLSIGLLAGVEPAQLELALERLFGVLLLIEVDGQLDVVAVDGGDLLDLAQDAAGVVDLVGDVPPLAVQLLLHAQLDAELADALVEVVPRGGVLVFGLGRDAAHVADDVARQRGVRVDPPRLLDDDDPGQVLDPLHDRRRGALVDALGDRHRQIRAVHLAVETLLHLLDRNVDPSGQAAEDLGAVGLAADHIPLDGDGQDARVVGEDPPVGVEDPASLGKQRDGAQLGDVDLGLQRLLLDGLEEPEARPDEPEQQHADEREDAKARGPLVNSHWNSLPNSWADAGARHPGRTTHRSHRRPFAGRRNLPLRLLHPQAPPSERHEERAHQRGADSDDRDDLAQPRVERVGLADEEAHDRGS